VKRGEQPLPLCRRTGGLDLFPAKNSRDFSDSPPYGDKGEKSSRPNFRGGEDGHIKERKYATIIQCRVASGRKKFQVLPGLFERRRGGVNFSDQPGGGARA